MMKRFLPIVIWLIAYPAVGQEKGARSSAEPNGSALAAGEDTLLPKQDFFLLMNSDDVELANNVPIHKIITDSAVYALLDHPGAAMIDSLWQMELLKSSLYSEDLQDALISVPYREEVFDELPTDTLKKRLEILDAKTPFKIEYNPILENVIRSYLRRNKKGMERLMALSSYYFPMFEQQLDKYNIPLEIKYLAIVESALNPRARSRVGATGLWQFMYATGKMHGLEVSSYVDERMDPIMATEAAAQYLSRLYGIFEDWDLVLASYNSGPGNVSKAIRRSGGSNNYWNLRPFLPRETAGYVPAFIATLYIFEYAEEHGFQPPAPRTTYFETDTVHVRSLLTFNQISKVTGVEKELLQFLNPSYKLDIIPYIKGEDYSLRLPRSRTGFFVNNEEDIYAFAESQIAKKEKPLPRLVEAESRIRYRVRSGDYLGKIAEKYGVRVSQIKKWNDLRSNKLSIGQRLTIFPRNAVTSGSFVSGNEDAAPRYYTVQRGDSLWSISRKFPGLSVERIKELNDMDDSDLRPGMRLKLSKG